MKTIKTSRLQDTTVTGGQTKMNKQNRIAAVEYDQKQKEAKILLKAISSALKKHEKEQSQKIEDWGFVGDLDRVNSQLEDILKSLVPNII